MLTYVWLPSGSVPPRQGAGVARESDGGPEALLRRAQPVAPYRTPERTSDLAVLDARGWVADSLWDLVCPALLHRDEVVVRLATLSEATLTVRLRNGTAWDFEPAALSDAKAIRVPDQFPAWPLVTKARGLLIDRVVVLFPPTPFFSAERFYARLGIESM